jgi:N-acetylglutamate synthase-like GNAT family acetyltransferase
MIGVRSFQAHGSVFQDVFFLGGFQGETLVGNAAFQMQALPSSTEKAYRIASLFVESAYRHQGIGTLLLLTGEDAIRNLLIPSLWCEVSQDTVPFFTRQNWEIVSEGSGTVQIRKDLTKRFPCH